MLPTLHLNLTVVCDRQTRANDDDAQRVPATSAVHRQYVVIEVADSAIREVWRSEFLEPEISHCGHRATTRCRLMRWLWIRQVVVLVSLEPAECPRFGLTTQPGVRSYSFDTADGRAPAASGTSTVMRQRSVNSPASVRTMTVSASRKTCQMSC